MSENVWKPGFTSTGHLKFEDGYRGKFYRGTFKWRNLLRCTLRRFERAAEASDYSLWVMARYARLLKAAEVKDGN